MTAFGYQGFAVMRADAPMGSCPKARMPSPQGFSICTCAYNWTGRPISMICVGAMR